MSIDPDLQTALSHAVTAMFEALKAIDDGDVPLARSKLEAMMTRHGEMLIDPDPVPGQLPPGTIPVRLLVDFSGGSFNGVQSTVPAEVLVFDADDEDNARARLPGFNSDIWAELQDAEVEPELVNAVIDNTAWLEIDDTDDSEVLVETANV